MNKALYLECSSGISGDMFVAALIDLGIDQTKLIKALESIPIDGYQIQISRVKKNGLDACDFSVILDSQHENGDHDMEYLHGHHKENHEHNKHHGHHEHTHRGIAEIYHLIEYADITEHAKSLAKKIFDILAEAESKAHGIKKEQVHFHEVGAVDSIVDIVAAAVSIDLLGIEAVIIPELSEGKGFIRCQHGVIPVPVPATANIISAYGLNLRPMGIEGEFVTPTGAAIAAALMTDKKLPETYTIERIGMGAGKRQYERPSLLRAMVVVPEKDEKEIIYKIESNIDDCSGEVLGYTMDRLLLEGAKDVSYIPIYMKKGRPAYQLNVLCTEELLSAMAEIIFKETTTIGIRYIKMDRMILARENKLFQGSFGTVEMKLCKFQSKICAYPEYECVKKIAQQTGEPFRQLYQKILHEWKNEKENR